MFEPLSQRLDKYRAFAHECKKTWLLANFENIDPKFYKKWRRIEVDEGGVHCDDCTKEMREYKDIDDEDNSLFDTTVDTTDLYDILMTEDMNCHACSAIWCKFSHEMLADYGENVFDDFKINKEYKIKTKIADQFGNIEPDPIEIKFEVVPKFYILDDSQTNETEGGKRVIYFSKVQNVVCAHPDFDVKKFKISLNYQAQLRMTTPYKIKNFSIGCLPTFPDSKLTRTTIPLPSHFGSLEPRQRRKFVFNEQYNSLETFLSVTSLSPETIPLDPGERQI